MKEKKQIDGKSFLTRTISGAILLTIAIATVTLGGNILFFTVAAISLIGLWEFYRAFHIEKSSIGITGYILSILYFILVWMNKPDFYLPFFVLSFLTIMAIYVFDFDHIDSTKALAGFGGIFYVVLMLSYIYRTRMMTDGAYVVWLIFLGSWGCDTCAYLVGILIGKHKMAPRLSPKKSIEGAIGGVIGAAILAGIYGAVAGEHFTEFVNPALSCAFIAAVSSLLSMIGDLSASAMKRNHDIKDFSNMIPGHGGILDRFDSIIFTAPLIYYLAQFVIFLGK